MLPRKSSFHVSRVANKHYDRITKLFRNIIKLEISPDYSQSKMIYERDVFSSPQMILTIKGPNMVDLSVFITDNKKQILRFFSVEEINREAIRLEESHNINRQEGRENVRLPPLSPSIEEMKVGETSSGPQSTASPPSRKSASMLSVRLPKGVYAPCLHCLARHVHARKSGWFEGSFMSTNEELWSNTCKSWSLRAGSRGLWAGKRTMASICLAFAVDTIIVASS
jgi:hypothetical protein